MRAIGLINSSLREELRVMSKKYYRKINNFKNL